MNKKVMKVAFIAAIAMVTGINVFNAQQSEPLSDVVMANVEALAEGETQDQYGSWSCCEAVWENVKCKGCDGYIHIYAIKIE